MGKRSRKKHDSSTSNWAESYPPLAPLSGDSNYLHSINSYRPQTPTPKHRNRRAGGYIQTHIPPAMLSPTEPYYSPTRRSTPNPEDYPDEIYERPAKPRRKIYLEFCCGLRFDITPKEVRDDHDYPRPSRKPAKRRRQKKRYDAPVIYDHEDEDLQSVRIVRAASPSDYYYAEPGNMYDTASSSSSNGVGMSPVIVDAEPPEEVVYGRAYV